MKFKYEDKLVNIVVFYTFTPLQESQQTKMPVLKAWKELCNK